MISVNIDYGLLFESPSILLRINKASFGKGERPQTAAFGSGPRPVLESRNGLRPVLKNELVRLSTIKNGRACQRWDIFSQNQKGFGCIDAAVLLILFPLFLSHYKFEQDRGSDSQS